jgi:hypothetical protein
MSAALGADQPNQSRPLCCSPAGRWCVSRWTLTSRVKLNVKIQCKIFAVVSPFRPKPPQPNQYLPQLPHCSIHPATLGVLAVKGLWPAKYTRGLSYGVTAPDPGLNWGQVSESLRASHSRIFTRPRHLGWNPAPALIKGFGKALTMFTNTWTLLLYAPVRDSFF